MNRLVGLPFIRSASCREGSVRGGGVTCTRCVLLVVDNEVDVAALPFREPFTNEFDGPLPMAEARSCAIVSAVAQNGLVARGFASAEGGATTPLSGSVGGRADLFAGKGSSSNGAVPIANAFGWLGLVFDFFAMLLDAFCDPCALTRFFTLSIATISVDASPSRPSSCLVLFLKIALVLSGVVSRSVRGDDVVGSIWVDAFVAEVEDAFWLGRVMELSLDWSVPRDGDPTIVLLPFPSVSVRSEK